MYNIGTFNKISPVGLERLTDGYALVENPEEATGIILRSYDMHEMEFSNNLLAIGRAGAGTNNIPVDRCTKQGIVVFNAPGANANAVKELCLAGMLMAARNIPAALTWAKMLVGSEGVGKQIEKGKGQFAGTEIQGKTLGIIGLGSIGILVANAAEQLGMKVIGYDAFFGTKAAHALSPTVQVVDQLKDLYPVCDYISIHVPANDQTRNMINAEAFTQMKDGVVFLNFARDKLINDEDLLAAIDSGRVGRYVTDFADDAVLNADKEQIIVIPHLGASSAEAEDNCASMAVDQVMDYLENGNITNSVNFPAVSMGPKKGVRLCVMAKADAGAAEKVAAALPGVDMVCASKGDVTVVLAETTSSVDASALSGEGIIRVRVIE